MNAPVHYEIADGVAVLTLDHPPVNAQSLAVRAALLAALKQAIADPQARSILLRGAGKNFAGGADLNELAAGKLEPPGPEDIHALLEDSPKPTIAALQGATLGGGLELALACHYRIVAPDARLGLPEVLRGLLPGAGGTQRLPRLIGARRALNMILSGAPVDAKTALEVGLVDALGEGDFFSAAINFARGCTKPRPTRAQKIDPATLPDFDAEKAAVMAKQKNAFAPQKIVDCVAAAVAKNFDDGLAFERAQFETCLVSPQAKALLHVFFAERRAARPPADIAAPPRQIESVGVIGAGLMGSGIATALAQAGFAIKLVEQDEKALARGLAAIGKNFDAFVARGKISAEAAAQKQGLVSGGLDFDALQACDLVIEAAFESFEIKSAIMQRLGKICRPGAIIATNTSTLDVDALAEASGRPQDVIGLHFFSPAHVMRLLEIVRGEQTAPDVVATGFALAKKLGKTSALSGVCYGFIGNRMLEPYLREADALVLAGVAPEKIDAALENFGMAMGPCRMMDMAGLDLGARLVEGAQKLGAVPARENYRAIEKILVAAGRLGAKNGLGFYRYDGRKALPDPELAPIVQENAKKLGVAQTPDVAEDEIVARCLLPLINEAAKILEEGIAQRASDIDVVWTSGYGFPVWRGGPLHHADALGTAAIVTKLKSFSGPDWAVAPLLEHLAASQKSFADLPQN